MSNRTPNLGLYVRGPVSTENAANGGVPTQWDFDLNMAIIDAAVGGGGSTSVLVNGASVANPNFNGTTPAAPAGNTNVVFQVSGSSVSGYVPTAPVTSVAGKVGVVTLAGSDITSGVIALVRGGTGVDLSASGSATAFLAQDGSHVVSARAIVAADVPSLDASKITTGTIALARGGTGVDLSATGGTTFVLAQDASHVISARALVAADIPNISASKITSGTIALAQGGTNADLSASGSSTAFLAQDASHVVTARAIIAADIPSLDAGKITTGTIALARGGTGVDLSATGGSTFVLAQDASHVISARALVAADIPNLAASKITSGTLALAQGGTNADLSGSGSATAFLAQDGSHVVSARAIVAADVPNLDASKITTGALALARGGTGVDLSASGSATSFLAQDGSHVVSARALVSGDIPTTLSGLVEIDVDTIKLGHTTKDIIASRSAAASLAVTGSPNFTGSIKTTQLATPAAPTVTPTLGFSNTYAYKIVAKDTVGVTVASTAGQTTAGAATLDGTHFNTITWAAVAGAVSYDVYRTSTNGTPSTTGLIGNVLADATLSFVDNGVAGDSSTAPTANTTGQIVPTGAPLQNTGAGFFAVTIELNTAAAGNRVTGTSIYGSATAGGTVGWLFYLPYPMLVGHVNYEISTGVAATTIDIGLYKAAGGANSLVANIGATSSASGGANAPTSTALAQGTILLAPGWYYFAVTVSSASVGMLVNALGSVNDMFSLINVGSSGATSVIVFNTTGTGGSLPTTMPTWSKQTTAGSNPAGPVAAYFCR